MKITWCAHAAFLLEGDGLRIVTDPYLPEATGLAPIVEPADVVIRSSSDDEGHCHAAMIGGNPAVVTATEIDGAPAEICGLSISAIQSQESLIHKESPRDNAMYRFTLAGIRITHLGDVGNRLTNDQLQAMQGTDVLLAPTGGPPTIDLDDLCEAIRVIRPAITIPMHYRLPRLKADLLPINEFTRRFPPETVTWHNAPTVILTPMLMPACGRVIVLEPSTG